MNKVGRMEIDQEMWKRKKKKAVFWGFFWGRIVN
jgi:hypothetical protein